jgi:very-short-patch-repair endonuclease
MAGTELRALLRGGVLLTSAALEAGWAERTLARRLRSEGWVRLQAGAWGEPGRRPDLSIRLRAVQLLKPGLVVSHRSAAVLWRIEMLSPVRGGIPDLDFTDPGLTTRREGTRVRVHRMPLAAREITVRWGLRVTHVNRTVADLLRAAGPRDDALVAVESALTRRSVGHMRRAPLTTAAALVAELDAPLLGAPRARDLLKLVDPGAGSPAETIARLRLHDSGLRPESQVELRTPDGRRRFLDFLFRAEGLAVEIEGYAYHGSREAHRRDIDRFNQVLQCSEVRLLLRYTAADVFQRPERMIEEIRAALGRSELG